MASVPAVEMIYPESDGKPMADNMTQGRWIHTLSANLQSLFVRNPNVLVAHDHLWYPVQGRPDICQAPDVYVVFGRAPDERPSYRQWLEDDVPLTVAFEIWSLSNTISEMADKLDFYEEYGVEEYYEYNPYLNHLMVYQRRNTTLVAVKPVDGFRSPRLGISFDFSGPEMIVRYPDGRSFLTAREAELERQATLAQIDDERCQRKQAEDDKRREVEGRKQAEDDKRKADLARLQAETARQVAEDDKRKADAARQQAEDGKRKADLARLQAEDEKRREADGRKQAETARQQAEDDKRKADTARQQAEDGKRNAEQRFARMKELSRKTRQGQASADELRELDELEQ